VTTTNRLWHWFTQPNATSGMRDLIAVALLGMGIIRAIDGLVFATLHFTFAPQWLWAVAQLVCGGLLLLTRTPPLRHDLAGRVVASVACGLCVAMAAGAYGVAATTTFVALVFAWVLFIEAGPGPAARDC